MQTDTGVSPSEPRFRVGVSRVLPGCAVREGQVFACTGRVLVGRGEEADIVLEDLSISRLHAAIQVGRDGLVVQNLSARASVFLNARRLAPESGAEIQEREAWLQLGRVLLHVTPEPTTVRFDSPMPLPSAARSGISAPLLRFRHIGNTLQIWLLGHPVVLFPGPARVLARLSEQPGAIVPHDLLDEAADPEAYPRSGGATVAQLVSAARTLFVDAMDEGIVPAETLAAAIEAKTGRQLEWDCHRSLGRELIENIRGVGYRLHLPDSEVEFIE